MKAWLAGIGVALLLALAALLGVQTLRLSSAREQLAREQADSEAARDKFGREAAINGGRLRLQ